MAVKTVQYVFNGQTYDLTFDASTVWTQVWWFSCGN